MSRPIQKYEPAEMSQSILAASTPSCAMEHRETTQPASSAPISCASESFSNMAGQTAQNDQTFRNTQAQPLGGGFYVLCDEIHRFGIDALLLAWFASPRPNDHVCDLGTGCGILPLLWARDRLGKKCEAVELQPEAAGLAQQAITQQGLTAKIQCHCADLRRLEGILPAGGFDLVTCNPPFYPVTNGKLATRRELAIARQEVCCTLEDAVQSAARLLRPGGRFCLCHRPERLCDVMSLLRASSLEPKRMRLAGTRRGESPFLVLVEGKRNARPSLQVEDSIILEDEPWASQFGAGAMLS